MNLRFSPAVVELIKQFEGFKFKPYLDTKGIPTIGFGSISYTNGQRVTMKDPSIDMTMAGEMLLFHLNEVELPDLEKCITREILQNQLDAIGCLTYNIGDHAFCGSTLHQKINENAPISEIEQHWLEWDKVNDKVIEGLLNRRKIEFNHYNKA